MSGGKEHPEVPASSRRPAGRSWWKRHRRGQVTSALVAALAVGLPGWTNAHSTGHLPALTAATVVASTVSGTPAGGVVATAPDHGGGAWELFADSAVSAINGAATFGSPEGSALSKPVVGIGGTPDGGGYWLVASDGGVFSYGDARFYGSTGGIRLDKPIVGMAATPDGHGYWLVASDGGIFAFGDARFYGSTGGIRLDKPIVGMAATPDGHGYWLVASDGGIFAFGDARFYGSTGGIRLDKPIVGMAATPDGHGYWLVASDGGIFAFGDARFYGSTGGIRLDKPIVGMAATPDGHGYWLVASDGGIFAFGDARFYGSTGGIRLDKPIVGMAATPDDHGYWLVASDGGIFAFGDARFHGSLSGTGQSVVGLVPAIGTDGYTLVTTSGATRNFGTVSSTLVDSAGWRHKTTNTGKTTTTTVASDPTTTSTSTPSTTTSTSTTTTSTTTPSTTISTSTTTSTSTSTTSTTTTTVPGSVGSSSSTPPGDQFGIFDSPLAANTPISSQSSELAADIVNQYQTYYGTFGVQNKYPIVTVPGNQAMVTVGVRSGCSNFESNVGSVPVPSSAASMLAGTSDNPLLIWQPSTSTEWEFWEMSYSNGSWTACWGGKITNVSTSGGVFTEPYGLAASGISYLATAITEQDIQSGSINHPIALQLPLCTTPFVAPATRTDCGSNAGTPAEGMLFRFPANLTMPSGLTPFGQMVFRAIQTYGMYVTDHAGAVLVVAEDPNDWTATGNTGTDPLTASWQGQPEYSAMNGIPWSQLQQVAG